MKGFKTEKGITLVALIITIIVMLILVGVTINLAVSGGLFDNARNGSKKTQERIVYEEVISSTNVDNEGFINVFATYTEVKELMNNENKTIEVTDPVNEEDIKAGMESITIKILDKYVYTITKDRIIPQTE